MASTARLLSAGLGLLIGLAPLASARADSAAYGKELYELCAQCHGSAGEGNQEALAPAIAGLEQWYVASQLRKFKSGLRGLHPEDVGGLRMYPMSLSLKRDEEIDAVAAHVAQMPPARPRPVLSGGDAQRGAPLYVVCASCHGTDGAGNQALEAPRLTGASDWYLFSSLEKYKAGIRGGNPANQGALIMRGMAMSLADEQAIKDVVAYIGSLSASDVSAAGAGQ